MAVRKECGFSMIEMMIVVAIIMVVLGVTFLQIGPMLRESSAQAALQTTLGIMRRAHETAVDQRQILRVTFTQPRTIQVDQIGFDVNGNKQTVAFLSKIDLPKDMQFIVVVGMPTSAATVPEGFGTGSVPIDFDQDSGGSVNTVYFQRDGRALDSSNRINNGVVYMCRPADLISCKAVSLMGATGRAKGWRLTQTPLGARWAQ